MSYTLALGPFVASWRGPQRLVVKVEGERIIDVDYRAGYNERDCVDRLLRLNLEQALYVVTRICGVCSHAHAMAFCQAIETLWAIDVPPRATYMRCIVAEIERLASHLGTLTTLFEQLGQERYSATMCNLLQVTRQVMQDISGKPTLPDLCLPGGIWRDIEEQQCNTALSTLARLRQTLYPLIDQIIDQRALLARTVDVGVLSSSAAEQFGVRGPIARASGIRVDTRLNQPYAAYKIIAPPMIIQEGGDVYARLVVLLLESFESIQLAEQALQSLPTGLIQGHLPEKLRAGHAEATVEAPRGALSYHLESDGRKLTAIRIDPPRQIDRLLARTLLTNALIDNIMVIVLSTDPCTACAEC